MRRLIYLIALWAPTLPAQCDVELVSVDFVTGDIQMVVHESEVCGVYWGVPWINHIDIGVSNGVDTLSTPTANFPLHSFLDFQEQNFNDGYGDYGYAGDTLNFNMADALNANASDTNNPLTVHERWVQWYNDGTFCEGAEVFVWQINYSNAPQVLDSTWYNPFGSAPDYPDVNPWDNILPVDGLCPCDTIYIDVEVTDTIIQYVDVEWITVDTLYIVDTLYVDNYVDVYVTDTLWQTYIDTVYVQQTDTMYVDVIIDNYVYITDTLTQFVSYTTYVDCATGDPCDQISPCDETSIYAPNVVTPNADGWNDTWQVIAEGGCWSQWEVRIYNRWGGLVWISASSTDEWIADVATGLYVYTITAHSSMNASVYEFNGTVTVLY